MEILATIVNLLTFNYFCKALHLRCLRPVSNLLKTNHENQTQSSTYSKLSKGYRATSSNVVSVSLLQTSLTEIQTNVLNFMVGFYPLGI